MPSPRQLYSDEFYEHHSGGSRRSGGIVLDALIGLGLGPFTSVIDIGCGAGAWLDAALERGASRAVGVDGPWNSKRFMSSDQGEFIAANLDDTDIAGLIGDSTFDLGLCLEVVEHLPASTGERLVALLADRCTFVALSAAIPGQGGTGHQNEQWPSYWARICQKVGLEPFDLVRPRVWSDPNVDLWYRQNLVLYARPDLMVDRYQPVDPRALDVVHPEWYLHRRENPQVRDWLKAGPSVAARGLRAAVRRARRSPSP